MVSTPGLNQAKEAANATLEQPPERIGTKQAQKQQLNSAVGVLGEPGSCPEPCNVPHCRSLRHTGETAMAAGGTSVSFLHSVPGALDSGLAQRSFSDCSRNSSGGFTLSPAPSWERNCLPGAWVTKSFPQRLPGNVPSGLAQSKLHAASRGVMQRLRQPEMDGILTTKAMDVTLSPGTSEFTQVLDRNSECLGSGQPLNAAVSSL